MKIKALDLDKSKRCATIKSENGIPMVLDNIDELDVNERVKLFRSIMSFTADFLRLDVEIGGAHD